MRRVIRLSFWIAVAICCSMARAQGVGNTYAANCANCHGLDGRGNTPLGRALKLRDLHSPEVQKLSDGELAAIVSKGADRGKMPGFEKKLGAETVRKLATYVREIENQPAPAAPVKKTGNSKAAAEPLDVKSVYSAKCSHCHGPDGSGDTVLGRTLKLRDMRLPEAQKFSDDDMIAIIANGMDRGRMPGFQKKLGPEMVGQLASYVRVLAGEPRIVATKKAISAESGSKPVLLESGNAAVQVGDKASAIVQPEKQVQPEGVAMHKFSPLAKLSSVIIPARKNGPRTELVDLNSASKKTLITLPGITETDADNIIAGRPYKSTLQFKTKRIVAPETYAKIAGRVVAKQPARTRQPTVIEHTQ